MGLISLLTSNPTAFVIVAAALVLSLTVHEFAHAWVADRLGDPTPRHYGRVTLNPAAHLDPFGTLLMLLVGFGFARPVPVNFARLGRWGGLAVAAAGPISNLIIALLCALIMKAVPVSSIFAVSSGQLELTTLGKILDDVLSINVTLAVFNLIPIPILDGSRILGALVPSLGRSLHEFEMQPYSFIVVMAFIYLMNGPISSLINQVQHWVLGLVF